MSEPSNPDPSRRPSVARSLLIFVAAIAGMFLLKLRLFPERYVGLGYALPLLLCLWHRDRRLLWAMAAGFAALAALKAFVVLPGLMAQEPFELLQWLMQVTNILVVATTVHTILNLLDRLRMKNAQLSSANRELLVREERITQQNAELQAQAEELVQQNEELQQQGEELGRQNEELQQQAEELDHQAEELQSQTEQLQVANQELNKREAMLQTMLGCVGGTPEEHRMLEQVCRAVVDLLGRPVVVAAVLERSGEELVVRTQFGPTRLKEQRNPYAGSFGALVMEHDRTAFVDDLSARSDLRVPQATEGALRSVLATPLRQHGKPIGVVKVYSAEPQRWNREQFRLIEWVAAQCSLALSILRLQEELAKTNASLEEQVRQRTARLQEMVNDLEHFSYTITHDMRAPLRSMRGFAGTLKELIGLAVTSETEECLQRINKSAQRMDRLITDALSYSRSVNNILMLGPVDAGGLLQSILESYPHFQSPKAEIRIEGEIPIVQANEAGLTQCFSNLLDNAVKFVQAGTIPKVRVWAEVRDPFVRLWFEDNGIGIPPAFRPQLFQMFQRASKNYEGTGIGLALVKKVAERMGGCVGVDSAVGPGSRFWLELQLHTPQPRGESSGTNPRSPVPLLNRARTNALGASAARQEDL